MAIFFIVQMNCLQPFQLALLAHHISLLPPVMMEVSQLNKDSNNPSSPVAKATFNALWYARTCSMPVQSRVACKYIVPCFVSYKLRVSSDYFHCIVRGW